MGDHEKVLQLSTNESEAICWVPGRPDRKGWGKIELRESQRNLICRRTDTVLRCYTGRNMGTAAHFSSFPSYRYTPALKQAGKPAELV